MSFIHKNSTSNRDFVGAALIKCKYSTGSRHWLVQLAFANKQHIVPPNTFNYHITVEDSHHVVVLTSKKVQEQFESSSGVRI